MGAGTLEVRVDGTPVRALPAAGEWARVSLSVGLNCPHLVTFAYVRVAGEDDEVSQWTEEVEGTAKTLVAEKQGEGAVEWRHVKPGVWKAELVITTNGSETYRETRILDLRKYSGQGLVLFVM